MPDDRLTTRNMDICNKLLSTDMTNYDEKKTHFDKK